MSIKSLNHKVIFIGSISLLGLLTNSCKKENYPIEKNQLSGDTAIFIGTWEWIYSDHDYGWCEQQSYYEYLDSINTGISFSIAFNSNGIVSFRKNQELISEQRVIFNFFETQSQNCMLSAANPFHIYLNNNSKLYLTGCLNPDTMRLSGACGFLFDPESGCENYQNYFLKQ